MTTGLLLGVLAAFFWALTNLVDKYLVDRYADDGNIGGILLLSCFFPVFLMFIAVFFTPSVHFVNPTEKGLLMLSGVLMVAWIYFYLKALSEDDPSVVMAILVLAPFFSLIFASFLLGETLTYIQLIGGAVIMTGATVVSYETTTKTVKYKLLLYGVCAAFITGLMHTLFKFATLDGDFWQSLFWRSTAMVGVGLILFIISYQYRQDFSHFISEHLGKGLTLNMTNETLTLLGDTIFAFAILLAPLALVQTTEAYQPVFILIIVFILTKMGINTFSSNQTRGQTILKLSGILLVLAGSIIVSIF